MYYITQHKPLVKLCLATVGDNFHRYSAVYSTTEDGYKRRNFEFLQRKYSFNLLEHLCEEDGLPVEFIDILINKYLTILDVRWFRKCPWDKVTSKIAEMGSIVEAIFIRDADFEEFRVETPWQDVIRHLPNLKSFNFHDGCYDLILKNVANFCPNIEEINIESSSVTFEGAKYLCKSETGEAVCTKLKELCIADESNTDAVKYLIQNLPSLEIIDYRYLPLVLYSLHKNDLPAIDKVKPYNITKLDLAYFADKNDFDGILKTCLSVCPHLKDLVCRITRKEQLKFFINLPALEQLRIGNGSVRDININNILKYTGGKLTSLTIANCTVSMSVLAESCIQITNLTLFKVNFCLEDDSKIVFNLLCSLYLKDIDISTNGRAIGLLLSSSANLKSLTFVDCDLLSSEMKACILKCCELYPIKNICIDNCKIEKKFIKDLLLNCHTLSDIYVNGLGSDDQDELKRFSEILSNKREIETDVHTRELLVYYYDD